MTIAIITEAGVRKVAPLVAVAQAAAAQASIYAQAAVAAAQGRVYADYATGNAATTAGQYFYDAALNFYVNGTATPLTKLAQVDPSTGVLSLPNASAATPALTFSSDTDTGLFRPSANHLGVAVGGNEIARWASAGFGIGTAAAPSSLLEIAGTGGTAVMTIRETGVRSFAWRVGAAGSGIADFADITGGVPRIAVTAAGNVVIGGTSSSYKFSVKGAQASIESSTNADGNLRLINTGQDWLVGMLGAPGSTALSFYNATAGALRMAISTAGVVTPGADNSQTLGSASFRWSVVYAGTGTINTSDATEKEWLGAGFSSAELSAAKRISAEIGSYKWLAAIARENDGGPAARVHFGVRAQAVWAIMAEEGLIDPIEEGVTPSCPYGFLCYDEWAAVEPLGAVEEVLDENGEVLVPGQAAQLGVDAGSRFGIRPDQLAMFLVAAQEARLTALEALITEGE